MGKIGAHAVVVGASIGGLLAARVLADAYDKVTVTDRDRLPGNSQNRRGVPQGRHIHVLLPSGAGILEELFPGLLADPVNGGTPVVSDFSQTRASFGGHQMCDQAAPVPGVFVQPSRPYLEWQVRSRGPGAAQRGDHRRMRGHRPGCLRRAGPCHRRSPPAPPLAAAVTPAVPAARRRCGLT